MFQVTYLNYNTGWQRGPLPGEMLTLIFEELYRTAPASLHTVRLASRRFNDHVEPILYRHVTLNQVLVSCFEEDEPDDSYEHAYTRRRVRNAICDFTRRITIDQPLNWPLVADILTSLHPLHHLSWSVGKTTRPSFRNQNRTRIPQHIFNCLADYWPRAEISLDICCPSPLINGKVDFSTTNLVSLKVHDVFWRRDKRLDRTLETFLLRCGQLKVLHIVHARAGARYLDEHIEKGGRLPAIEELFLQNYFWLNSPRIATSFWDWSRLTSLRLEKVFIINFIESVSPENLIRLRSLITDGHCESAVDHTKATDLMARLVRAINGLEVLSLVCSIETFPVDSIRKHGPSLRKLQLRGYTGTGHQPLRQSRDPTLSLHILSEIQSFCPNLMELTLDIDQGAMVYKSFATRPIWKLIKSLQSPSFTSLLLECRNLRQLTMFAQQPFLSGIDLDNGLDTCFSRNCRLNDSIEVGVASNFEDRTYEAICTFVEDLVMRKSGAVFETVTMHMAGYDGGVYPDVLSSDGQRQQSDGDSDERTFVYETEYIDGRPVKWFEREAVYETTMRMAPWKEYDGSDSGSYDYR